MSIGVISLRSQWWLATEIIHDDLEDAKFRGGGFSLVLILKGSLAVICRASYI
jgi:hypothetical protein